jgi:molybdate transport system substrate-binding protein
MKVLATISLAKALNKIATLYKAVAPDVTLSFNFASSGKLKTQIENGAEADLFISAGQKQMDDLTGKFIDDATRKNLLVNKVVLIVPQNSTKGIFSFEDVLTAKVSLIALGNSSAPIGQYSEEIFKFLKGWDIVSKKAFFASNSKKVLSQVESLTVVDCGVVYATDAAMAAKNVKVAALAPEGSHKPVVYPAAVLKGSKNPKEAKDFLDFLSSPKAVEVFETIGFGVVK